MRFEALDRNDAGIGWIVVDKDRGGDTLAFALREHEAKDFARLMNRSREPGPVGEKVAHWPGCTLTTPAERRDDYWNFQRSLDLDNDGYVKREIPDRDEGGPGDERG
jgi:hypothetical protein